MADEKHPEGFKAQVTIFCPCGYLMVDNEAGWYCENRNCELSTRLYRVSVDVKEIPMPLGKVV